jgi:hypothetical protein
MANHNVSCGASDWIAYNTHTTDSISGIQADSSHAPDMYYFPYLMTGDYFYLEGLQMEAAYYAMQRNPCYTSSTTTYNIANRQGRWALSYSSQSVRAQAWVLRTLAYAGFISPDADNEKAYFDTAVKQQIQEFEGGHNLNPGTSGSYGADTDLAAVWTYGNTQDQASGIYWTGSTIGDNRGASPIGQWRMQAQRGSNNSAFLQTPLHCTVDAGCDSDSSVWLGDSPWEESFVANALGVAKDLGYSTDALLQFVAKKYFRYSLDATYNAPYQLQMYRDPHVLTATPNAWVASGAEVLAGYQTGLNQNCWQQVEPITCDGVSASMVMQDSHAFQARSAMSFMTSYTVDGFNGLTAWTTVDASIADKKWLYDVSGTNGSPSWSLVPRF